MAVWAGESIPPGRDTGEGPGIDGEAGQLRTPGEGIASVALPEAKGEPTPSNMPGQKQEL